MFELYTLPNKARVILVPQKDTKSLTSLIMYPVGSRYEPEKMAGVSHYIEHLMFKGTKKRKNTLVLTREIDRLGAEYNAFTSKEYMGYYIKADAAYMDVSLDILSDMLFNSVFDPKEMEREKGPVIEEIRMYNDNPLMNIENIFEDLMFQGCPLGRDIAGTVKHVQSYKRDEVLAYRDKYYDASNMTVVLAGNITDKTRDAITTFFGTYKVERKPSHSFKPYTFGPKSKAQRIVVQEKKTDQAQLMMGFPGFPYTAKDNVPLNVMNTILGGSMSSRLFIQIRERRGLAYMVKSGSTNFRDTGYVSVRAGLEAKNINKAISLITAEMKKLMTKGVTKRELEDAKTHIRGAMTLSMEDSSTQANWYGSEALFMEKIETPDEYLAKVDRVTGDDVKKIAKKVFQFPEMRIAVIGDIKKEKVQF
ncbi:MAG TPA: pitrilysin family protein [Candidatus Kapabacteria bacterium]|nr:pitrilysin family protein [Candidatus Kapabacteria bacterium]